MGRPFEDLAQEYVFDPIGMKDTSYTARVWYAGRLAVPRGPNGEVEPKTRSTWCAADLLRTTIGDYANFVVSVMHNEKLTKEIAAQRLTSTCNRATREVVQKACAERTSGSADCVVTFGMGLGWEVMTIDDETIIDHDGSMVPTGGFIRLPFTCPSAK